MQLRPPSGAGGRFESRGPTRTAAIVRGVAEDFVLARLLGDVERKRVLELGCGDGSRAVELARRGASVIAVDPSTEAVLGTRKRAEAAEVRIEVHTGDFADL